MDLAASSDDNGSDSSGSSSDSSGTESSIPNSEGGEDPNVRQYQDPDGRAGEGNAADEFDENGVYTDAKKYLDPSKKKKARLSGCVFVCGGVPGTWGPHLLLDIFRRPKTRRRHCILKYMKGN